MNFGIDTRRKIFCKPALLGVFFENSKVIIFLSFNCLFWSLICFNSSRIPLNFSLIYSIIIEYDYNHTQHKQPPRPAKIPVNGQWDGPKLCATQLVWFCRNHLGRHDAYHMLIDAVDSTVSTANRIVFANRLAQFIWPASFGYHQLYGDWNAI